MKEKLMKLFVCTCFIVLLAGCAGMPYEMGDGGFDEGFGGFDEGFGGYGGYDGFGGGYGGFEGGDDD
jgi:hypothetical protein